jgi:HPt (histidine-containing phosphotransfer) domain-containing protein
VDTKQQPPLDLENFSEIMDEVDEGVFFKFLDIFVGEFSALIMAIETAILAQDAMPLQRAVHSAKGSANQAAAGRLGEMLADMQAGGLSEQWEDHTKALCSVSLEFERVRAFIETHSGPGCCVGGR